MHRAEEILSAVVAALTGLPTTANRVERDRVYPPDQTPALSVNQGGEEPIQGSTGMQAQDSALEIEINIQVKSGTSSSDLNQIKAEVYAALMSNHKLGINYVHQIQWGGDTKPEPSGEADLKTVSCAMRFAVAYRHSYTSKES